MELLEITEITAGKENLDIRGIKLSTWPFPQSPPKTQAELLLHNTHHRQPIAVSLSHHVAL